MAAARRCALNASSMTASSRTSAGASGGAMDGGGLPPAASSGTRTIDDMKYHGARSPSIPPCRGHLSHNGING